MNKAHAATDMKHVVVWRMITVSQSRYSLRVEDGSRLIRYMAVDVGFTKKEGRTCKSCNNVQVTLKYVSTFPLGCPILLGLLGQVY